MYIHMEVITMMAYNYDYSPSVNSPMVTCPFANQSLTRKFNPSVGFVQRYSSK